MPLRRGEGDGLGDGLGDGFVDGLGDGLGEGSPSVARLPRCASSGGDGSRVRRGVCWPFSVCSAPSPRPDTSGTGTADSGGSTTPTSRTASVPTASVPTSTSGASR